MSTVELPQDHVAEMEAADRPTEAVAEQATPSRMYRFSRYLHVGPGAEECDEGENGACSNPLHFHAWLRLPNKFQHKDLRDKGAAAKARKMRALRDPESGDYVVLEDKLDAINDESYMPAIIDEITAKDWAKDYLTAIETVKDEVDDEGVKLWEHIDQDRERYASLAEVEGVKPEDEQSDEFKQLAKRVGEYIDALRRAVEEIQEPTKVSLTERGLDGVIEVLRRQRIEDEGDAAFMHVYNEWMWYIGTLKPKDGGGMPHERVWTDLGHMNDPKPGTMWAAAPEVIEAVEAAFNELTAALQQAARGNS